MLQTFPLQLAFSGRNKETRTAIPGSKLPPKPSTKAQPWDLLHLAVADDPSNIAKWDELLATLTSCWESANNDLAIKSALVDLFEALLSLYPYSTGYWRQYLQVKLRMAPKEYSKCLGSAVEAFPQSVPLWTEYVRALMEELKNGVLIEGKQNSAVNDEKDATSIKSMKELDKRSADNDKSNGNLGLSSSSIEFIRKEFKRGAAAVGRNFNSESFWDAYLDFESDISPESSELLSLYLNLVPIPLYLYAHFYNKFIEAIKAYPIESVIEDNKTLKEQMGLFGKTLPGDLSAEETQQILDTFTYQIFANTQRKVNESWAFESELQIHDYSHTNTPALETQYLKYIEYIDHEMDALDALVDDSGLEKKQQISQIVAIFERALVPHCHKAELWQKYTTFLRNIEAPSQEVKLAYERAIFQFSPIESHFLRDEYLEYLLGTNEFDLATQTFLKTLKLYSGSSGRFVYMKNAYVHDMKALLQFWREKAAVNLEAVLEGLITGYFDRVDRYKKENAAQNGKKTTEGHIIDQSTSNALSKVINDDGICIITVSFLKLLLTNDENTARIRKLYNKYHKETALGKSVLFWNFYVDYEGMQKKNLVNLNMIIDYVKELSALPKRAVDAFVEIQYELTCANLTKLASLQKSDDLLKPLISAHHERSNDLFINAAARRRQANIAILLESKSGHTKEQSYITNIKKHLGHPGVFADSVPEITNSWMDKNWIPLLDDDAAPPPLPTFRNLDKANTALVYNDIS